MKHIREYEDREITDLIDDLESVGHGGLIGFMWIGSIPKTEEFGFLVIGKDERDCVNQVLESDIFFGRGNPVFYLNFKKSGFKGSFVEMLEAFYENGIISDAGHYPELLARGGQRMIKYWFDAYSMNPKYCYDQAKKYFRNADEVFSKEEPESKIWEPNETH
jgi:hypothetical protein